MSYYYMYVESYMDDHTYKEGYIIAKVMQV